MAFQVSNPSPIQTAQLQPLAGAFSFGFPSPNLSQTSTTLGQAKVSSSTDVIEQPWLSTRFSQEDSDLQIQSADGIKFHLHRAVLEMNTGAFPGPEVPTQEEPVQLTENANVLAILFSFVYPKRHPDLDGLDFQTVVAIAEAAGKYEVFAAINTCNAQLSKFLPQDALDVFVHSVKHDYPKLMNEAIPHLCRKPLVPVLKRLPPLYMIAWSQYREAWQSVFKEATNHVKGLPAHIGSSVCNDVGAHKQICHTCRSSAFTLVAELEAIEGIATLTITLQDPLQKFPFLACCGHGISPMSKVPCRYLHNVAKLCREKIKKIPSFEAILSERD